MLKGILILTFLIIGTSCSNVNLEQLSKATVTITNKEENSGGTGVILKSSKEKTTILTNGHVCGVVANGGIVHSYKGKVSVERYTLSQQHDLCLLEVMTDLDVNTTISNTAPKLLDKTYVAGHPFLFPTTITEGRFSDSMIIQIIVGVKPCTKKEMDDGMIACLIFGGTPLVREYNTNVVSNLIAPGNSGSAVYNNKSELIGLIFAGSRRGMSPGIMVPYEYLRSFVDTELADFRIKPVEIAIPKSIADMFGATRADVTYAGKLKNLIFPAITSPELDNIDKLIKR